MHFQTCCKSDGICHAMIIVKTYDACPFNQLRNSDRKLRSREIKPCNETWNFKVKLQNTFGIFLGAFILKFCLFFKFVVISWSTKQITKFVKRIFEDDAKIFTKFKIGVPKF